MSRVLLVLGTALALVTIAAAEPPLQGRPVLFGMPAEQDYGLELNLTGTATSARDGEAFSLAIRASGVVTRSVSGGDGARGEQERGDLEARVTIVDPASEETVAAFTTLVAYHATRASHLARGLDGWRYSLDTPGREGDLLHFGLHGNVTGVEQQDGETTYLLAGQGQATLKSEGAHRATPFRLDAAGGATQERV